MATAVKGNLFAQCQKCLETFSIDVEAESHILRIEPHSRIVSVEGQLRHRCGSNGVFDGLIRLYHGDMTIKGNYQPVCIESPPIKIDGKQGPGRPKRD